MAMTTLRTGAIVQALGGELLGDPDRQITRLAPLERAQPGYEGSSVFPPGGILSSWASVIRFRTEAQLDAWLASPDCR